LEQSEWLTFNLPQFLFLFGYLLNIIYLVLPLFKTVFLIGGILFIFEAVKTIFLSFLKLFNVFSLELLGELRFGPEGPQRGVPPRTKLTFF
jgi:hypothetical protein